MKSNNRHHRDKDRGFALVVTLSMMILLTVIAVGLLSLSTISLRKTGTESATQVARSNARLALMLALGELQKAAGPDQRITADRTIYDNNAGSQTGSSNALGVWKSWSPRLADIATTPNYANQKTSQFLGWLTSSKIPEDLSATTWGGGLDDPIDLYTVKSDGFSQSGSRIEIKQGSNVTGGLAWTVVQEGTKAKINIGGPEADDIDIETKNDVLQAQARPSLGKSESFKQPEKLWNERAGKVLTLGQAKLDPDMWKGNDLNPEHADFTTTSMGLLTDVVYGGFKTDLNLGFELPDGNFDSNKLGSYNNPFRAGGLRGFNAPPSRYNSQRPLFRTLTSTGSVKANLNFPPASTEYQYPVSAVPTFTTLRSFYKTPYYMYNTADGPTIFERPMDHMAVVKPLSSQFPAPGETPRGNVTQTGYRPVLDRVIYVLSMGVDASNTPTLVFTPIITLWNPYNVALEIEGATACPWLDMPFQADWTFHKADGSTEGKGAAMSTMMGFQFVSQSHGRTVKPYFLASITQNGGPGNNSVIRFQPGEVRVFAPATAVDKPFAYDGNLELRTVRMKPVDNPNQLSVRGGMAVPMRGMNRPLQPGESLSLRFKPSGDFTRNYPFAVTLEDATRAKQNNPSEGLRGQCIADVQTVNFADNGAAIVNLDAAKLPYASLKDPSQRIPFGMIETYHRVAEDSANTRRADIVYTTNPRQSFINRYVTNGEFKAGPHYETVVRPATSFGQIIQTTNNGRSSYYGRTNSAGTSHLAFFEAPQQPLISLAAFQHADISSTAYSTASQIGNSWASAYVRKNLALETIAAGGGGGGEASFTRDPMPVYDYAYLANEALWDSFFFSSIAPVLTPSSSSGSPSVWNNPGAKKKVSLYDTLSNFVEDPEKYPLRNSRMKFYAGNATKDEVKEFINRNTDSPTPESCMKIAAHLQVDGAFNINSTSVKAWVAFLSGSRDANFTVRDGSLPAANRTAFPRFRNPVGTDSNHWNGYRSLSDNEIQTLAGKIVDQVRLRGPFLSLGEFVNRRVDNSNLAFKGALQTAIDDSGLNSSALYNKFDIGLYPAASRANINTPNTGVGIPGYLTQADLLQSLAPVMTPRSDTFTIRAYGEAKDKSGKIIATARCEAVVQRMPEYCDSKDLPDTMIVPTGNTNLTPSNLAPANVAFGRKFAIVSFRYLADNEIAL